MRLNARRGWRAEEPSPSQAPLARRNSTKPAVEGSLPSVPCDPSTIGASVLASLALMTRLGYLSDVMLTAGLVAAAGGGLFAGYMRSDRAV